MNSIEINCLCKINFGLNIIEKRGDGFHNIETVFYPIDLCDKLILSKSSHKSFSTNSNLLNGEQNNIILQAMDLLQKKTGEIFEVEISLQKKIPIGAGMGGGSSDAAATLLSLNELYELKLSTENLREIALSLGSDVPFFLKPYPHFAESRGEKLTLINFNLPYPILIINPGIHISTKWAYQDIIPLKPVFDLRTLNNFDMRNIADLKDKVTNSFEEKCFERYPVLSGIKEDLYKSGALFALMTGSGSTLFGIFQDCKAAQKAEERYKNNYFTFINMPD